jgi:hypothetical protein
MSKRASTLEWQVAKDDTDWTHLCAQPMRDIAIASPPPAQDRSFSHQFLWGATVILLFLAGAGGWWWRSTQSRVPQSAVAVTATAQQDPSAVTPRLNQPTLVEQFADRQALAEFQATRAWTGQSAQYESDLDAGRQTLDPGDQFDLALYTVDMQGDQAVTRVVTMAKSGPYRQTLFYRRTAEGWQQLPPDAAFWGLERSLETPFFVYHFRQQDAAAVVTVASQVNNLYMTLRRNLGLPLKAWEEKLVIDVRVTQSPGHAASQLPGSDRLMVPSPAVYWAPVEVTDADLLAQSIALPLLDDVLAQASERNAIGPSWWPLLAGLRLWQLWDLDLPLATWQAEVVRWLYADEPAIPPGQPVVLPDYYEALCAQHTLWMSSPTQLGIPLLCTVPDWQHGYFAASSPRDSLTHLDQLTLLMSPDEYVGQTNSSYVSHPGQTVALATLIEYAVVTYGSERLPVLIAGLGQYESWETLLPAVYGVSPAEFEAGWQAYLATRYGLSFDVKSHVTNARRVRT